MINSNNNIFYILKQRETTKKNVRFLPSSQCFNNSPLFFSIFFFSTKQAIFPSYVTIHSNVFVFFHPRSIFKFTPQILPLFLTLSSCRDHYNILHHFSPSLTSPSSTQGQGEVGLNKFTRKTRGSQRSRFHNNGRSNDLFLRDC